MKLDKRLWHVVMIMVFCGSLSTSSYGQFDKTLVLNQDLDQQTRAQIEIDSKNAAAEFVTALLTNDLEKANAFFPSKEVYSQMIQHFGFRTEEAQLAALENLEIHYEQERQRVYQNFTSTRDAISAKGSMEISNLVFSFKENVALPGGRAAVVLKQNSSGNTMTVYFYKFYKFEGRWYITNKVRTDS
ncbi:MAG: hypothetical protein AAF502_11540 [Bacteroidota bacterium]